MIISHNFLAAEKQIFCPKNGGTMSSKLSKPVGVFVVDICSLFISSNNSTTPTVRWTLEGFQPRPASNDGMVFFQSPQRVVHCQPWREGFRGFFFYKVLNRHFSWNSVPLKNTNPKLWCFQLPFVLFSHSTKQRKDALKQLILESTSVISIRSGVLHQDWSEMRVGFDQKIDVPTTHGFLHRTGCFSIVEDLKENQQAYHGPEEQEAGKAH